MKNLSKKAVLATLILTLFLITISSASAADVYMNSTNNTIANAVENQTNNTDTIYLDEGTYNRTHLNGSDGININKNLTIIGKGADKTIIDAEKLGRIFYIESDGILTLIKLTLINGHNEEQYYGGGAIYNIGTLKLINCELNNNTSNYGGAISSRWDTNLNIINSTFANNHADEGGGAIGSTAVMYIQTLFSQTTPHVRVVLSKVRLKCTLQSLFSQTIKLLTEGLFSVVLL